VLHLLYARFCHKVLYDLGFVSTPEPFQRLVNQGLILGEDGEKMSKSRGNVVNPDEVIRAHGADAFRLYEMFLGPLETVKPWSTRSIEGVDRFLQRVWRLGEQVTGSRLQAPGQENTQARAELERKQHETIKRVTEDIENLRLNTAIAAMREFLNALYDALGQEATSQDHSGVKPAACSLQPAAMREALELLVLLLSPFAPHIAEELWQWLGHSENLAYESWPVHDPAALEHAEILWVVQVNGKVRARVTLPAAISEEQLRQTVVADEQVKRYINNHPIKQVIIVPKRLVNIVV
jgi:leucyl-tRNA synthetase